MTDRREFHTHCTEAEDDLSRASSALHLVDVNALAPTELIAYAQARAVAGFGRALLAQVAQQEQPPLR